MHANRVEDGREGRMTEMNMTSDGKERKNRAKEGKKDSIEKKKGWE